MNYQAEPKGCPEYGNTQEKPSGKSFWKIHEPDSQVRRLNNQLREELGKGILRGFPNSGGCGIGKNAAPEFFVWRTN